MTAKPSLFDADTQSELDRIASLDREAYLSAVQEIKLQLALKRAELANPEQPLLFKEK